MYHRVYSPDGEPFDVHSRDRADHLILERGWTQSPVTVETPEEDEETMDLKAFSLAEDKPKKRRRTRKKAEETED